MKVVAFNEIYCAGGGTRYMVDCLNAISKIFNKKILYTNLSTLNPSDNKRLDQKISIKSVVFFTHRFIENNNYLNKIVNKISSNLYPFYFLCNTLNFFIRLYAEKPDLVWSFNGGYPASYASLAMVVAAKLNKIPVILSIVSMPALHRSVLQKYMDKIVWKCADVVLVNCKSIADSLHTFRNAPLKKIEVVFNGVENRIVPKAAKVSNSLSTIACVSRMDNQKGVVLLIKAYLDIAKDYRNSRLCLVGEGDALNEINTLLDTHPYKKNVILTGYYSGEIFDVLKDVDIFVMPSFWEGLPYTLIEAMCAELPIITTDVGGVLEIVSHKKEAYVIPSKSRDAIAHSLKVLLEDEKLRNDLAKHARKKFEMHLNIQNMQLGISNILKNKFNVFPVEKDIF